MRPVDTNAHFGSERLHRAEEHVRGKMHAHCLGLFALSSLCVLATSLFSLATKSVPALHVSLRELIIWYQNRGTLYSSSRTHARCIHAHACIEAGVGLTTLTMPCRFHSKCRLCMWCVSQCSECEEGQCCLSFCLTSLLFHCSATHSLTCWCMYPNPTSQSYPSSTH